MKTIVDKYYDIYRSNNQQFVLPGVFPIIWFGNTDKYFESHRKIISVGLYPSSKEFTDNNGNINLYYRFPNAPIPYSKTPQDYKRYKSVMDTYFDRNPYMQWFRRNEEVLNYFGASYNVGKGIKNKWKNDIINTALHIDMIAPVAPNPGYNLPNNNIKQLNTLYGGFFNDTIAWLNPDIIVVSASKKDVKKKLGITHSNALIHLTSGYSGYMDLHYIGPKGYNKHVSVPQKPSNVIESPALPNTNQNQKVSVVWGLNRQTPFSGSGMNANFIETACKTFLPYI